MAETARWAPSSVRPVGRTVLPGTAMIAVSFGLARYGYGLLLPDMQADLSISPGAAGLIASGTYVSYLVANVGVVWLTRRGGPRAAIALATLLAAGGMMVIAVAGSAAGMAAGVVTAGAAAGLVFPPYADLVASDIDSRRRDLAWSTISSGTGWGVAIAGPIAIIAGGDWRVAWMVFVALAASAGIVAVRLAPGRRASQRLRRPQLSPSWFLCPKSRPLLISALLIGTGSAVWWAFSVDALRHAGLGATTASVVYAVCGAAGILASVSGVAFTRLGLRPGYLAACILLAASLVLLSITGGHVLTALLAAVLFGVFYNSVVAAQGIWSSRVFADHPSAGLAAVSTALTIGTLLGPSIAGTAISRFGFPMTLLAAAAVILAALVFCPPGAHRRQRLAAHRCRATPVRT
ncbi:MAG: MFS transporter [Solirubrobacterales bacterium]|nr:MFS transporter [Solirubrobacterales bacterium]